MTATTGSDHIALISLAVPAVPQGGKTTSSADVPLAPSAVAPLCPLSDSVPKKVYKHMIPDKINILMPKSADGEHLLQKVIGERVLFVIGTDASEFAMDKP